MSKGAIVYLAPPLHGGRHDVFLYSLQLMEKNFNQRFAYPVIIFHEDFTQEAIEQIQSTYSSSFTFVHLPDFTKLPEGVEPDQVSRWMRGEDGGRKGAQGIGYRQMCRFYAYGLLMHPALEPYDYYWRFDDDSFLIQPITEDPFETLEQGGYIYGYRSLMREDPRIEEGHGIKELLQLTKQFAKRSSIPWKHFRQFTDWRGRPNGKQYYTNFEINKVSYWRNNELYRAYIAEIEKAQGIYKYRWGDACIRSYGCALFLKPEHIYHFETLPYRHNYHYAVAHSKTIDYYRPSWVNLEDTTERLGALAIDRDSV